MSPDDADDGPRRADSYEHPDGTREVVFHVADDRVLTVREYPDREAFREGVADAADAGRHEGVADLPGVEAFAGDSGDGTLTEEAGDEASTTDDSGADDERR